MTSAKDKKEIDKTVAERDAAIKNKVGEAKARYDAGINKSGLEAHRALEQLANVPHVIPLAKIKNQVPQLPRWNCYSPAVDFALILTGFGLGMTVTQFVERFL